MNNDSCPSSPKHLHTNSSSPVTSSTHSSSKSTSPRSRRGKTSSIPSTVSSSTMSKDSACLSKLKGLKWKNFWEFSNKNLCSYSDEEDVPISELGDKSHSHSKSSKNSSSSCSKSSSSSSSSNTSKPIVSKSSNKSKGSVMRLDKADMGLFGLCPETDPFYAVICDICGNVVKPQGLQKHMSTRHHSHYNYSSKSSNFSSRDHLSSSNDSRISTSSESNHGGANKSEKLGTYSSNMPLFDDGLSQSSSHSKSRSSSSSSKVKSKSGKNNSSSSSHGSHHNGKSSSSSSTNSSSTKSSNSSTYSPPSTESVPHTNDALTPATTVPITSTSTISTTTTATDKKGTFSSTSSGVSSDSTSSSLTSSPSGKSNSKRSNSKSSSTGNKSERKVLPIKDREYDPDKHCGVTSTDTRKQCTRSLTCKSHSLSSRRAVSGRSKTFDKLLLDHRLSKETSTASSNGNEATAANSIEVESSSNSSSSFDIDRRSSSGTAASTISDNHMLMNLTHLEVSARPPRNLIDGDMSVDSKMLDPYTTEKNNSPIVLPDSGSSASSKTTKPASPTMSHSKSDHHRSKHKKSSKNEQIHLDKALQKLVQQKVHAKHQLREQAERDRQSTLAADILAKHFAHEIPNTILTDATIVMDPNTNLLKLSVSGTLRPASETEAPEESIQQFATNLMQEPLPVTVPLSVISSMNISGTGLPNITVPDDSPTNIANQRRNEVMTSHMTDGNKSDSFIPPDLIEQPNKELVEEAIMHETAHYTSQELDEETLSNLQIPSYDESINFTLQTLAQNLPVEQIQMTGQTMESDLSENIDDIVPTINLLPTTAPLILPALPNDLSDTLILTPNQISTVSQAMIDQHFVEAIEIKPEIEPLTVNMTPIDFSKLLLLKKVDDDFIKQNHHQNVVFNSQIDEFRGVKMWYNTLPKPLHINNFQMRKIGGGMVLRKKLLNIRKTMMSESQNISKSLNAQISPLAGSRSSINFTSGNNRSDIMMTTSSNLMSNLNKSKDTNGGISLQNFQSNNRFNNRGQRRLIMPINSYKKPNINTALLNNNFFKNLLASQSFASASISQPYTSSSSSSDLGRSDLNNSNSLKRSSSSSLTSLSNKRLKIINNLQNSTAPPQLLLQSSPKHKPKVL